MDIVRQSLAITFVLALLWAALWLLRKRGAVSAGWKRTRGQASLIESRGRLALSPQHSIHLVRIGQRDFILALHPSGVTLLAELPASPENQA
jgi:flagellar biosynthetic protein FliO